jgi:hypothetical protein
VVCIEELDAPTLDEFDNFRDCVDAAFKQCPNVYP